MRRVGRYSTYNSNVWDVIRCELTRVTLNGEYRNFNPFRVCSADRYRYLRRLRL